MQLWLVAIALHWCGNAIANDATEAHAPGGQDPAFFANASSFLGWILSALLLVLTIAQQFKRKPSVDVDVTRVDGTLEVIQQTLKTHKEHIDTLFDYRDNDLRELRETLGVLQLNQGANSTAIKDTNGVVHSMQTDLRELAKRIDSALQAFAHSKK